MKRFLTIALMICMCLAIGVFADEVKPVTVTLNGETVDCASYGQEATIVEGRTLVPLRAIFEALGATVEWDGETKTVSSVLGETTVKLTIGENTLYKNDEAVTLDVPAQIMNGRTLVPARAVAEAFGVSVEWNSKSRTVVLNKEPASVGKSMFGMTKEDVSKVLGCEIVDDEYSMLINEEMDFDIDLKISRELLHGLEFGFSGDKLVKIILITNECEENDFSQITDALREYYGEPEKVKKDGDELVWLIDDETVEVTAIKYVMGKDTDKNQKTFVEVELKYIVKQSGEVEEKETEEEKIEYLYGNLYLGMSWEDLENGIEKLNARTSAKTWIDTYDLFVPIKDEEGVYNDEDETVTGKTNVKELTFYIEDKMLKNFSIETDPMTREDADFVVEALTGRYGGDALITTLPEIYEWRCKNKTVMLEIHKIISPKDKEKAYYVTIDYTKGEYVRNDRVNLLDQIPLGLDHDSAKKYFAGIKKKISGSRIEFTDIKDQGKGDFIVVSSDNVSFSVSRNSLYELYERYPDSFFTEYYGVHGIKTERLSENPYKSTYVENDDIFGQGFACEYISLDLIDGVYDNCYVKTNSVTRNSAAHTMNYVAKYFGLDAAVYDEENQRYEWENYSFKNSIRGFSRVNIFSGIAEDNGLYYCYVSVHIAKEDRYSMVDESGRFLGMDYKNAYGNLYFGMTPEQAKYELLGETKSEYNRIFVYDSGAKFDDEDERITLDANAEIIELAFDNKTEKLCAVIVTTSEISDEEANNILSNIRNLYGDTESADEKDGVGSYVWLDRESGLEIRFDTEKTADAFICTYSITVAGSNLAKI